MTDTDGPNSFDPGPDPDDFLDIDREGAIWDALTEMDPLVQNIGESQLLAGWVNPRDLLILVNRIRTAQGLTPVPRLTTRYAIPGVYSACMFARALRTWASMDTLIFRSQWHAERVAAELGVPLAGYCSIETPHEICDVMELFDCGLLSDRDVYVPLFEQLSLSAGPVELAEEVLAMAATQTAV